MDDRLKPCANCSDNTFQAHVMSSRVGINAVLSYKTNSSSPHADSMEVVLPAVTAKTDETTIDADVEQGIENSGEGGEGVNEEITPSTPLDDSIGVILTDEDDDDENSHHDNNDDVDDNNETEDEPSIINLIVDMASNCEVLSIRGSVF